MADNGSSLGPNGPTRREFDKLDARIGKLEDANVAVLAERMHTLNGKVEELKNVVTWLLRTVAGLAVSLLIGLIVFLITTGNGG